MVNFGLLTAEICWRVWGTPANFNGFRTLAALLHGTLVAGVSQTLHILVHSDFPDGGTGKTCLSGGIHYQGASSYDRPA